MTTITKERLLAIKQWRETYGPGSNVVLPAEEAEELARIALAALEAEPVLYQSCTRPTWNSGVPWTEWKERSREGYENDLRFTDTPDHAGWINKCRKLYTTPPVPVMQADVAQAIENLKQKLVECNRYNYCADAVKGVEDASRVLALQNQNMSAPITPEAIENAIEYIRSIAFHINEEITTANILRISCDKHWPGWKGIHAATIDWVKPIINQYAATRLPNPIAVMSGPAILILITPSSCSIA